MESDKVTNSRYENMFQLVACYSEFIALYEEFQMQNFDSYIM